MSIPRTVAACAALLLVVCSPRAFGWAADYKQGESISTDGWPPRLVALVNLPSRIAGYFINQQDYFAFKGDTEGFRACLETCLGLAEFAPTTLHIHHGKGAFQPLQKEKSPLPCDWQLDVINQQWRATEPSTIGPNYTLELHIWLGGAVDFAAIKTPPTLKIVKD